jgi:hypothetical protein
MTDRQRELKSWEVGTHKPFDLKEESRIANPELVGTYGRNSFTYTPELYGLTNEYWRYNEAGLAHGYPMTSWLQLGIIYGCGVYTAREQGILKRTQFFGSFMRHHYFDWISFVRRAGIYGVAGGLVAGTVLFGNPDLSIRRIYSKYELYFKK